MVSEPLALQSSSESLGEEGAWGEEGGRAARDALQVLRSAPHRRSTGSACTWRARQAG